MRPFSRRRPPRRSISRRWSSSLRGRSGRWSRDPHSCRADVGLDQEDLAAVDLRVRVGQVRGPSRSDFTSEPVSTRPASTLSSIWYWKRALRFLRIDLRAGSAKPRQPSGAVLLVDEADSRLDAARLLGRQLRVARDDDEIAGRHQVRRGAVHADDAAVGRPLDDVGLEAVAVRDVPSRTPPRSAAGRSRPSGGDRW